MAWYSSTNDFQAAVNRNVVDPVKTGLNNLGNTIKGATGGVKRPRSGPIAPPPSWAASSMVDPSKFSGPNMSFKGGRLQIGKQPSYGGVAAGIKPPQITIDKNTPRNLANNLDPYGSSGNVWSSLSVNKTPKENLGSAFNAFFGTGVMNQAAPNLFGNRSPYERVTGKLPPMSPNGKWNSVDKQNQQNAANNFMGGPEGFAPGDPNQGPFAAGDIVFPDYANNPAWKAKGVMGGNEDATDTSAIGRRYAMLQGNLKASEGSLKQQEQDAMARRFASMGALNSGAAMRNQQLSADAADRRFGEQRNALYAAQSGEEQAAKEAMIGRNLARDQLRLGSQEAALAGQSDVAKAKMGNVQFEKELDLNRAISAMNAQLAWDAAKQNNDPLRQLTMGAIGSQGMSWSTPFGRATGNNNPFAPWIAGQGGSPGGINWGSYQAY